MKFEFFSECQTATRSYYDRYWQILEEAQLADELGWDSFGTSEQHFTPELFTTAAPEVFYAAVAMRTKRLRLRHGIRLLPYRVNHPLRIAEQVAMLDILSNGRAELGTGRGNTLRMLRAFEVDPKESRAQWEEALSMIPKIWTQDPFSWEGKYFHIPPTHVVPKPVQKPHPAIWTAATNPDMYEIAGHKGIGLMSFNFGTPETAEKDIGIYRKAIETAEPVGDFINNKVSWFLMCLCAETTEYAKRLAREPIMAFLNEAVNIYEELGATGAKDYEYMAKVSKMRKLVDFDYLDAADMIVVGDPVVCLEKLRKYQKAGADEVILRIDGYPHEKIKDSIRLLAEHVFPYLR